MDKNKKGRPGQENGQVRAGELRRVPLGEIEKGFPQVGSQVRHEGHPFTQQIHSTVSLDSTHREP